MTELLALLLKDWVESRSPKVAARIERVTRLLPTDRVRRLQDRLPNLQRKHAAAALLREMKQPPDPRWGSFLTGWLDTRPFVSGRDVWGATLELLAHTGDPRTKERLALGVDSMPWETAQHISTAKWLACDAAVVGVRSHETALDLAEIDQQLEPAEARHERIQAEIAELWGRVAAERHLESALVLGDRLSELGDPRGEFVQLQCIEEPSAQVRMQIQGHLNLHRLTYLGRLAPVVHKRGLEFQLGVLHAAAMAFKSQPQLDAVIDAPEWDSLRDLAVNATVSWSRGDRHPLLQILERHPGIHTVREVYGWRVANQLLFGGRPLEALYCWSESPDVWARSPVTPEGEPVSVGLIEVPFAGVDTLIRWMRAGVEVKALRVRFVKASTDWLPGEQPDEAQARAVHHRLSRYCKDTEVRYGRGNRKRV